MERKKDWHYPKGRPQSPLLESVPVGGGEEEDEQRQRLGKVGGDRDEINPRYCMLQCLASLVSPGAHPPENCFR